MSQNKIETREDALGHIALKRYETQKKNDEAWLRYFIYGDIEDLETCDIYLRVHEKRTHEKKFPTKFALALIEHLVGCEPCYSKYMEIHLVKPKEDKQ